MTFSKYDLDNIKSKVRLSSEIEKKTKVIKKGKDYWCCCLFHNEKTPSCKINDDMGSYYCFGCGAKGDIFSIYTNLYNYTFQDAVKELAQLTGVKIDFREKEYTYKEKNIYKILELSSTWFQNNLNVHGSKCHKYLSSRSLSKNTISHFKLGYSYNPNQSLYNYLKKHSFNDDEILESNVVKKDQNNNIKDFFYKRLIFPITNLQGNIVGFGGRVLDDSNPKYINSPESIYFKKRNLLYNLYSAKSIARKKNNLLICEGYMDVISLYEKGINSVVAPLGTSFTEEQLLLSWRYVDKPTVMFDGDSAGIRASYKASIMSLPLLAPKKFLQFIILPYDLDPDNYLNKYPLEQFIEILKKPVPLINFIFDQASKTLELKNADDKIMFDKYIDDIVETINDKKIKYFYKNEFKTLFFDKLKKPNFKKKKQANVSDPTLLKEKEILSFFATFINHTEIRSNLLEILENATFLNTSQKNLVQFLKSPEIINKKNDELIKDISDYEYKLIIDKSLEKAISLLFPYSHPKFDSKKAFDEVQESAKILNTRLLNLKKINKSLDNFESNSNSLNWEELQRIGQEIRHDAEEK